MLAIDMRLVALAARLSVHSGRDDVDDYDDSKQTQLARGLASQRDPITRSESMLERLVKNSPRSA